MVWLRLPIITTNENFLIENVIFNTGKHEWRTLCPMKALGKPWGEDRAADRDFCFVACDNYILFVKS